MREIRFRGKRIDNGEWAYGYLFHSKYRTAILVNRDDRDLDPGWFYPNEVFDCREVDPETVGQYTGLKDEDSTEIYEGDILKVPDLYELPENTSMTYHYEVISYENGAFTLGGQPIYEDPEYISEECEVVGNRWDNPELLGG